MKHHNAKVSEARSLRGDEWRSALVKGRLESQLHPSKLRLARLKSCKSQSFLAMAVGIPLSSYCAIEKGHRSVAREVAFKIAALVKAPVGSIFKTAPRDRMKVF